ncbi:MAG: DUF3800 domain-containing protein [Methanobrevibacter sp.]|nr:DUF3800 domain-containing protein [Methanobrevibacter sp.]
MYNEYLFLDESGNLGLDNTKFFIITILRLYSSEECLKFKSLRTRILKKKFKRELANHNEIKFKQMSNDFKIVALNNISEFNIKSYSMVMDKTHILNKKLLKETNKNKIYMDMIIELLKCMDLNSSYVLRMDKFLPRNFIEDFNYKFFNSKEILNNGCKVFHSNSAKYLGIQFVDLISGSCFQSFERNNHIFLDIIKNKHKIFYYKRNKL